MRYVVFGAGAIGGTIGGRLFQQDHELVLIARGAHGERLRSDGLTLSDPDETVTLAIPTVSRPSDVRWKSDDVAVLAMKTQDTAAALQDLAACAPPTVTIVCAQNGLENERLALRAFAQVHGMCVMLPAAHISPGEVEAYGRPLTGLLDVGAYPSGRGRITERIAEDLDAAGFSSHAVDDVMRLKRGKLLLNLANTIQAMTGMDDPRAGELYKQARSEARACFEAAGLEYAGSEEDRQRRGDLMRVQPIEGKDRGGGSTWQSLARGGPVEADYLNGEIVLLGRLHGVPTPVNELLQRAANAAARDGRAPESVPIEELLSEAN
ncbi:MAG: 2-dehydropantoate 2-reductase [Actinomycetota bacterium]|nr:2-dehydropantoate 2-reductase [Actinomycetota bacterium]